MATIPIRNLIFLMQKRFLTTLPSLSSSSLSSSYTARFLMERCGFTLKSAISVSQTLRLSKNRHRSHEAVLIFLRSHGFSDIQIVKVVTKYPQILQAKVGNNLRPKIEYLHSRGLANPYLQELIVFNPIILKRSLDEHIKPVFEFLRDTLETDEKIVATIKRSSLLLTYDLKGTVQPNISFLIKEGVPKSRITKLIILQPRSITQHIERTMYAAEGVRRLGIKPSDPMYIHAFRAVISMNESTWKKKVEMYKSLGWTDAEILSAAKRFPYCMCLSEEKVGNLMNFYTNTVKVPPSAIAACPYLLGYSLATRIQPRYNVIKVLESKKLLGSHNGILRLLSESEVNFLRKYVTKNLKKVPYLMELYHGAKKTNL